MVSLNSYPPKTWESSVSALKKHVNQTGFVGNGLWYFWLYITDMNNNGHYSITV